MSSRFRQAAILALLVALPIGADALGESVPGAGDAIAPVPPIAPVPSIAAALCSAEITGLPDGALGDPPLEPVSCTYNCFNAKMCPYFPDREPAMCLSGCCVFPEPTCNNCAFDYDCGSQANCYGGCCYYWW